MHEFNESVQPSLKVQSVNVNSTLENHGIALNLYRKNLREPICLSDCKVYLHKKVIWMSRSIECDILSVSLYVWRLT